MLLDEIKSVLTFAAFKPEADDASVPWAKRFEGRRTLLLNVGRGQTSWRGINKKGKFEEGGSMEGEFADIAPQRAEEWREIADGGWCALSSVSQSSGTRTKFELWVSQPFRLTSTNRTPRSTNRRASRQP